MAELKPITPLPSNFMPPVSAGSPAVPSALPPGSPPPETPKERIKRLRVEIEKGNNTSLLFLLDEIIKKLGL